jgi:tetratricopeptide (TPR) repeat protein
MTTLYRQEQADLRATAATSRSAARWRDVVLAILLLAATTAVYQPAWKGGFLWDDRAHITKPELQSTDGLRRIWFELGATQQYYPLTHSVFWLEHKLWGDATLGYHLVSIFLHAVCAVLLMKVLQRLEVPGAALAAAIFALHPLQVESVAWMTELKNTLSGVFYFAAAWAYLRYDQAKEESTSGEREIKEACEAKEPRAPAAAAPGSAAPPVAFSRTQSNPMILAYSLALGLFILGLLSKSVVATLPAALLVALWWKRGTLTLRRVVLPLSPFFVLGIAAGILTAIVERRYIGAQGQDFDFTVVERLLIAGRVALFYPGKLLWPAELIFIYPRWDISQSVWWQYIFPVASLACLGAAWGVRKLSRGPLAAMLIFLGTLAPVLGFVNVYPFRFSFVADHFQYLASASLISLLVAGAVEVFAKRDRRRAAKARRKARETTTAPAAAVDSWAVSVAKETGVTVAGGIGVGLSLVLLGVLSCLSWSQSRMYADGETLYQTTITRNPACWMAYSNLGYAQFQAGRFPQAMIYYDQALRLKPDLAEAHNNLGAVLEESGRRKDAQEHYRAALRIDPTYAEAYFNLGVTLEREGKMDDALEQYGQALRLNPGYVAARNNRGIALAKRGRFTEAIDDLQAILRFNADAKAHNNLGLALARAGRTAEAVEHLTKGVRLARAEGRMDLARDIQTQLDRVRSSRP